MELRWQYGGGLTGFEAQAADPRGEFAAKRASIVISGNLPQK